MKYITFLIAILFSALIVEADIVYTDVNPDAFVNPLDPDYLIDIGPGSGVSGGYVVAEGTPMEIMNNENSITGKYLSGKLKIDVPAKRRKGNKKYIEIKGCSENNLKDIDVKIPLKKLVSISGVSGSGKSTLINDILAKFLSKHFYKA
ncbi:MAG TPA: hypothetical protein P5509_01820, partial [Bacteroidales bacterium]|nr:hypothetical protein [Bacteroidales bacterium]